MTTENEIKELFKVGAHFAFSKSRRHPSAKPFIFGAKNEIEIFDLEKTSVCLAEAKEFAKKVASEGGSILFVGSKSESQEIIKREASSIDMPYVAGRWIGGTLTNFPEIRKRVEKMENLTAQREKGELAKYTKKERLLIDREIEKLEKMFSGLVFLKSLPQAIFVVDSKKEAITVSEAKQKGVKVLSLSGSDCDLNLVDFPIPGNDTSVSSIEFFVKQIIESFKEGRKTRPEISKPIIAPKTHITPKVEVRTKREVAPKKAVK
ncbi:MAG: 30S ribosomal protein S2 [Patescibacteria group bacterium]